MTQTLLTAIGLMLVFEGVFPFITPTAWRETFRRLIGLSDSQIRFIGFSAMILGLLFVYLSTH